MAGKVRKPGPYSRRDSAILRADRRTAAGRFVRETEGALLAQIGGDPSPMQQLLVKVATITAFRLSALAERIVSGDAPDSGDTDARFRAFSRLLLETADRLGVARPAKQMPALAAYAAEINACRKVPDGEAAE